ncbi:CHAP domain-containing protein [Catellatospora sp. KI3]|uniref:CHAP domain-containing protein n=1 Tax=Catellatospora sp. KI3 TaxID=3041620 RepID=UPI002482FE31|nr:CHAP domain-containing protein [Catellatospora sp. KI3]MDI1461297.1 CHAP domain-containing protein [Catellatospora sp. KI3]
MNKIAALRTALVAATVAASGVIGVLAAPPGASAATLRESIVSIAQRELNDNSRNYEYRGSDNCTYYSGQVTNWPACGPTGWRGGTTANDDVYAWCANFSKYVWREAGVTDYSSLTTWAQSFEDYGADNGTWHAAGSYTPQPGDAIVFDWDSSPNDAHPIDHVGIVVSSSGGNVSTIEGNSGNKVSAHTYSLSNSDIVGYSSPIGTGTAPSTAVHMTELVQGEFTNDTYADLIALDSITGRLWLYPGTSTGGSFGARINIGFNWNAMQSLVTGEFTRDGIDDLMAVEKATGKLWLYPGLATGGGLGARIELGTGWNAVTELTSGDFNRGDDYDDLLLLETATGKLWLYPGLPAGGGFGARVNIGTNWGTMQSYVAGEFNRDSYEDLLVVEKATGTLWLYPGTSTGGSFGARVVVGSSGWTAMSDLTAGDFNRGDAYDDLLVVEDPTTKLWLYPGVTAGGYFGARIEIGSSGW